MSGQTFPDELLPRYQATYGGAWLRDRERPRLDEVTRRRVRQGVAAMVARVKQRHGLA